MGDLKVEFGMGRSEGGIGNAEKKIMGRGWDWGKGRSGDGVRGRRSEREME